MPTTLSRRASTRSSRSLATRSGGLSNSTAASQPGKSGTSNMPRSRNSRRADSRRPSWLSASEVRTRRSPTSNRSSLRCPSRNITTRCSSVHPGRDARRAPAMRTASGSPPHSRTTSAAAWGWALTREGPTMHSSRRTPSSPGRTSNSAHRAPSMPGRCDRLVRRTAQVGLPGSSGRICCSVAALSRQSAPDGRRARCGRARRARRRGTAPQRSARQERAGTDPAPRPAPAGFRRCRPGWHTFDRLGTPR